MRLRTFRFHTGIELIRADSHHCDSPLKLLWHHSDAIVCCSLQAPPSLTFANQAGFDMLETTLVALQDIMLENFLAAAGRKALSSEFPKLMQQGFAYLPPGFCVSSMGRAASYRQAAVWKVLDEENAQHCLAFMFGSWHFV